MFHVIFLLYIFYDKFNFISNYKVLYIFIDIMYVLCRIDNTFTIKVPYIKIVYGGFIENV